MKFRSPAFFSRLRDRLRRRTTAAPSADPTAKTERDLVFTLAPARLPSVRQLRYLPRLFTPGERFFVRILSAVTVVSLVFLGARFYSRHVTRIPRAGGEVVEALVGTPQYINPVLAGTNDVDRDLARLIYAGLFRRTASMDVVPDLAGSYQRSDDGKTYTVVLDAGLTWSDGEPLSADDVLMTFELIQDPLYKSPIRSQFRNVKVERVDERTVRFTLNQPSPSFLSTLTVGIIPAHIWGDVPPPNFGLIEYNLKPVGAGPFIFDSLKRDPSGFVKEYHLKRNSRYHGDRPFLDQITFKLFADQTLATQALAAKNVESVSVVAHDERDRLRQVRTIDLQLPQYAAVFFNAKRGALKAPEVRQALTQAIDRDRIIRDVLHGAAFVVDGPFAPAYPGYGGKLQPSHDPAAANAALDAAGWTKQTNGVRKKGNDELAVNLSMVDQEDDQAIATIIAQSWEAIGAKVELKPYDPTRIAKDVIKPRDYDALLYGEILMNEGDLYPFWHSSQQQDPGLNLTRFYSKDADKLLDELRTTTDPQQIVDKRLAFQRYLADSHSTAFLFSPAYTYGLGKRVKGFDETRVNTPADRFNDISHWYVNTKVVLKK